MIQNLIMSVIFIIVLVIVATMHVSQVACNSPFVDLCPQNCTCTTSNRRDSLEIDCTDRVNPSISNSCDIQLEEEINHILTSMKSLTQLTISNTQLSVVPTEVCNKTLLHSLKIDHNYRLSSLPSNCFRNINNLQLFQATYNDIRHLPDGLFDGLMSLQELCLEHNNISSIGRQVFSNISDNLRLKSIRLNGNRLNYIEPWPFIRGKAVQNALIDLSNNDIEKFINTIGWKFNMQKSLVNLTLKMSFNRIHRIADLIRELNLSSFTDFLLLFGNYKLSKNFDVKKQRGYICDCQDYDMFAGTRLFQYAIDILSRTECSNIPTILRYTTSKVPLENLVCNVEKGCPAICSCTNQPSNATFHVHCQNTGLTILPKDIPPTYIPRSPLKTNHEFYKLDFSRNNISMLSPQHYFNNTIIIDISNSQLQNITAEALTEMTKIKKIYLHNNLLTTLPPIAQSLNLTFTHLTLYGNPLSCGCEEVWLKAWLTSVYDRLINPEAILCSTPKWLTGRAIFTVNDQEFCKDPATDQSDTRIWSSTVVAIGASLLIVILSIMVILHFRVKLYAQLGFHPFDRDECEGENLMYDVFIAFAHADRVKARELLSFLETNSLKVCFHERDFMPGQAILDEIYNAICGSKRILCLVSDHFLGSRFGLAEFEIALNHHISLKRRRLVIVLSEEFDNKAVELEHERINQEASIDASPLLETSSSELAANWSSHSEKQREGLLRNFISNNTYVRLSSDVNSSWQQQLMYAMPMQRMGNCSEELSIEA